MLPAHARQAAILLARQKIALKPIFLDTETTGLGPGAEIVDICLLEHDGGVLIDTLVKPVAMIPADATRVHGITNAMVAHAPTWKEVWPQVAAALGGRQAAIYNMAYDVRLMQQSHRQHRLQWSDPGAQFFCIMELYAQFNGAWDRRHGSFRFQSLAAAGEQCRIALLNSHRARADAALAREVLRYMASRVPGD
jgi:DNA polymerase III epsilon subunit-like protein